MKQFNSYYVLASALLVSLVGNLWLAGTVQSEPSPVNFKVMTVRKSTPRPIAHSQKVAVVLKKDPISVGEKK